MAAEGRPLYFTAVISYLFRQHSQPWYLTQTWHAGRKWCRFINAPQKFRGPPQKYGELITV